MLADSIAATFIQGSEGALMMKILVLVLLGVALQIQISSAQDPQKFTNSIGMEFVLIPKGSYIRGSPPTELNRLSNEDMHHVTLTKDFYLGAYEVTQQQFEKLMRRNPSHHQGETLRKELNEKSLKVADFPSEMLPVESVHWNEAVAFCKALSELPEERKAGREYRLPTEAEWERACRAESSTAYFFGDDPKVLGEYAWYKENSHEIPHPIGQKKPNRWGLFDIQGNVQEWCSDGFDDFYPKTAVKDPVVISGSSRVVARGGYSSGIHYFCRSAKRWGFSQKDIADQEIGFRVAMTIPVAKKILVDR